MLSVKHLTLTDEQKVKLVDKVISEVTDAVATRSEMEKQWKIAVRQYNGRLKRWGVGDDGPQANLDIPITREYSQQSAARLLNPFVQQDTYFVCIPRVPEFEEIAREYEEVLDYICDKANIQTLCEQAVKAAHIFSYTVVKVPWIVKKRVIKEWKQVEEAVRDESGLPLTAEEIGPDGFMYIKPVTQMVWKEEDAEVEDLVGAIPELVPSEDFIFPTDARDVDNSRWVDHRFYLNKLEQRRRIKKGDYLGDIKTAEVEQVSRPDFAIEEKKLIGIDISTQKLAEYHEMYVTLGEIRIWLEDDQIDPEYDDDCEVILTIDKTNKQYRRGVHNFFHEYPRPFVTWSYEGRKDGIPGVSLAYILLPIHQAYSGMICQELDAQSAANENIVFGRSGSDAGKAFKGGRLRGGYYETIGNPREDLMQFNVSQPRTTSPAMRSELQMHAERVAAVSAINFGQDPTSRPTATGQTLQTNEAAQPLFAILESFRLFLSKIAYMMLARYKQFYPDGMPFYLREDTEDGTNVVPGQVHWASGAIETSVFIETKVSSGTMNKNLRRQEKLSMMDKVPQIYMTLKGMVQEMMMNPALAPTLQKLMFGYQVVIDDFFTEFEIANKEQLNPDLSQEVNIGQQIQGLMQQIQQMGAQIQAQQAQLSGAMAAIQGQSGGGRGGNGPSAPPYGPSGPPGPPPPMPGPGTNGPPPGGQPGI